MRVKLGEEHQELMFSVCVHGEPALHGGKIALVGWILTVSLQRFGASPELDCEVVFVYSSL